MGLKTSSRWLCALPLLAVLAFCAACKKELPAGNEPVASSRVPPLPAEPSEPAGTDVRGGPLLPGGSGRPAYTYYSAGGETFDSLAELEDAEYKTGFTLVGSFVEVWPCRISAEEKTLKGEMRFELQNAGPQAYTGFAGYELKLLRLICSDDREAGAVFKKRTPKQAKK